MPEKLRDDREYWVGVLTRISPPVLTNLAQHRLRERMARRSLPTAPAERHQYAPLEADRTPARVALAPWLELGADTTAEGQLRREYAELARSGIDAACDPRRPIT